MSIYHNFIVGSLFNCVKIVVNHPLSVMMFSTRNNIAHISTLNRVISVIYHKLICLIHVAFIISYRRRCFMVHHHLNTLAGCVTVKFFHIKVWIRSYEIKYIIFCFTKPVFPTFIPSFNKYCIKSVCSCKVNIFLHIFCIGRMFSVRFGLFIICNSKFNTRNPISIRP